jgi:hypothetical protein
MKTAVKTTKSASTIQRNLRDLRRFIDSGEGDPCEMRIAQAMENAIRWATESTVGWPGVLEEAKGLAHCLRGDLKSDTGSGAAETR